MTASAVQTTTITPLTRPPIKMFSVTGGPIPSTMDTTLYANTFQLAHGNFSPSQILAMKTVNPAITLINYMNSTYTANSHAEVHMAELNRSMISMTLAATLTNAINSSATSFTVSSASFPIAIKASTITGTGLYSTNPSVSNYVIWLKVDTELMKVTAYNASTNTVTVIRGFDGSTAAAHSAGTQVYSPMYVGQPNQQGGSAGNFPGGTATHLRYCLDPWSVAGNDTRVDLVLDKTSAGYDGAWLDTCNTGTFNLCDLNGRAARPWKLEANGVGSGSIGSEYPETEFRDGQDYKMDYIQDQVTLVDGVRPALVANNLRTTDMVDTANNQMMAALLKTTTLKPTPIDGFCFENFFNQAKQNATKFAEKLNALRLGIKDDLAVMPAMADAGFFSVSEDEPDTPTRDALERFAYAFYLLAVQPDQPSRKSMMGSYGFYYDAAHTPDTRFVKVHPQYNWPIGNAVDPWVNSGDYTSYVVASSAGSTVYRREFDNAFIYVNGSATAGTVTLPQALIDPDMAPATYVTGSVTIQPFSGKIYLKQPMQPPALPWKTEDIGAVAAYGSASVSSGTYSVIGSGAGIAGTADECRFLYQPASGDCEITAYVSGVQNTAAGAQVGVMIRESTAADSKNAFVVVTPSNGIIAKYRNATGGATNGATVTGVSAPYYIRIKRVGSTFTRHRSTDGITWTSIGSSVSITMNTDVLIGLVTSSNLDGSLCTGTISNVSVTP